MTKADQKFIKQLQQKKYRKLHQAFVVEGWKSILDFIKAGYLPQKIWAVAYPDESFKYTDEIDLINDTQLRQISFLKNPKDALAIFKMKQVLQINKSGLIIALDDLQDPGNLGTIIRTADWFGIRQIVCSENTVDCYNPKVVQATMGSLANVSVIYTDLLQFLQNTSLPVLGTFLKGQNIYQTGLPQELIMVIGNEGNGIGKNIEKVITKRITIPKHRSANAESLNASVAAAIVISEYFRRNF